MSKYTAGQVENLAYFIDGGTYNDAGDEISDAVSKLLDYASLLREREAAKAGVTHAMRDHALSVFNERRNFHGDVAGVAMLAALEAVAPMLASARVPDDVRVALDECRADLNYLFGRVAADGSFGQAAADSMRHKLDKVAAFHATLAAAPKPGAEG